MLAKKHESFISLKHTPAEMAMPSKMESMGPNLYISGVKLPVSGEEIGQKLSASVQLKLTGINQREGEDSQSYDFEVLGIKFT